MGIMVVVMIMMVMVQVGDPRDERSLPGTPVLFHVDVITSGATKVIPDARACVCVRRVKLPSATQVLRVTNSLFGGPVAQQIVRSLRMRFVAEQVWPSLPPDLGASPCTHALTHVSDRAARASRAARAGAGAV